MTPLAQRLFGPVLVPPAGSRPSATPLGIPVALARDLAQRIPPVRPSTRCEILSDRFASDSRLYAIPVVDGDDRPVGLVNRFRFLERAAGRYGRALTDRRPVATVMDRSPLILDEDTPLDDVGDLFVVGDNPFVLDGFIVTSQGRYSAVATGFDVMRALTERRHAELSRLAEHDILTGLPNRDKFERRLAEVVSEDDLAGPCVGLLFVDLDRFKHVNDTFGHRVGDLLLCAIAQRLRACARPHDMVARLSGDEFAIILQDLTDPGVAEAVAASIIEHCQDPMDLDGHEIVVSCSVGAALYPEDATSADGLGRAADAALYHAKQMRNLHQRFRRDMSRTASGPPLSFSALRRALDREELRVSYQPLVDLRTMAVTGVEALVRWRHPSGDMVPAEDLIRLAEDSGLIIQVSEYVLRMAMRDLLAWGAETGRDELYMAVNISSVQLREEGLAPMIDRLAATVGFDPRRLTLEVTESAAMRVGTAAYSTLRALKARGCSVAIDDFGTGYSSLGQLERLPVDILKIDQTFVAGIGHSGGNGAIARAIIALSHSLGLRTVAEGVETEAQLAFLRDQRCDAAQGYLLGSPMSYTDILHLIHAADGGAVRPRPDEARRRTKLVIAPGA